MELRIATGVVAKRVGDEVVIVHLQNGHYYGLDPVGARAWELIEQRLGFDAIVEALLAEYEVARPELEADLTRLVADLRAHGLLV